jgi:hypothetical protein
MVGVGPRPGDGNSRARPHVTDDSRTGKRGFGQGGFGGEVQPIGPGCDIEMVGSIRPGPGDAGNEYREGWAGDAGLGQRDLGGLGHDRREGGTCRLGGTLRGVRRWGGSGANKRYGRDQRPDRDESGNPTYPTS